MSGSGGGGSPTFGRPSGPIPDTSTTPAGPVGGDGGQPDPCERIVVDTVLQSPQAEVIAGLRPGDQLRLQLTAGGAPVVAATAGGRAAGSVVIRELMVLIGCLRAGRRFVADVVQVDGGSVTVLVRPETP